MYKLFTRIFLVLAVLLGAGVTAQASGDRAILVAYFSATGNTERVARQAAELLGADLCEIVPAQPYTASDLDYFSGGRADREQDDPRARPAIAGPAAPVDQYDTILLGYPIWHGQAPRIISTFLESYDLSGKDIIPFCTSIGSGLGSSAANLHSLAPNSRWEEGRRFGTSPSREDVERWLGTVLPDVL